MTHNAALSESLIALQTQINALVERFGAVADPMPKPRWAPNDIICETNVKETVIWVRGDEIWETTSVGHSIVTDSVFEGFLASQRQGEERYSTIEVIAQASGRDL